MRRTDHSSMSVIGAGKVGSTLAVLLHQAGYRIVSVVSRKKQSAGTLARLVGCRNYSDSMTDLSSETDFLMIAIPEEYIPAIAEELAGYRHLDFPNLTVFHTSGSLTSDALLPMRRRGAQTFSLHPIQSFPQSSSLTHQLTRMSDVVYGFEGGKRAWPRARRLVKELNGTVVRIPKEEKILYHSASVLASNYSVALLGAVDDILRHMHAGIELAHFKPIVGTSIEHAFRQTPGQALTGPIVRGSVATVEQHARALRKISKQLAELYQQLGLQALKMATERKSLQPDIAKQMRRILRQR